MARKESHQLTCAKQILQDAEELAINFLPKC